MIRCITGDMPNMAIDLANLRIPKNLTLADPQFYRSRSIDLLIGSALFWNLLCIDQIPLVSSLPVVQKTRLRWIVAGPMASITRMRNKTEDRCYLITTQQLHDQVAKFWELEECTSQHSLKRRPEDTICEEHFRDITIRNEKGRFVVSIPFQNNMQCLGQSREQAQRWLFALERKLRRDSSFTDAYWNFMRDYERAAGHMSKILTNKHKNEEIAYYLPHHVVKKEGSISTKVKIVFDGSAKTSNKLAYQ